MESQTAVPEPEELRYCVNPETGYMTRELHQRLTQNCRTRCTTVEHTFIEELPNGRERRYAFVQEYHWVTERQMLPVFRRAGFTNVKVCGGYGLRPFKERSYRLVFLAEK